MTDRAIAGQLKALADDYQRRAEKASHVDAAKALARSAADAEASGGRDLMGSITAQPAEEMRGERWDALAARLVVSLRTPSLTNVWSEYGRGYSICPKV